MNIKKDLITVNKWSRPGRKLEEVLGIVLHWTANPPAGAQANRNYFDSLKSGKQGIYASAHYIIGQDGLIVQAIPEDEAAWHVGSSAKDPKSGKIYTDLARELFGRFASNPSSTSPNFCTIGIELCPTDWDGSFSEATIESAKALCADLLLRHGLGPDSLITHNGVVGWKDCPRLWTKQPDLFEAFREGVAWLKGDGL